MKLTCTGKFAIKPYKCKNVIKQIMRILFKKRKKIIGVALGSGDETKINK